MRRLGTILTLDMSLCATGWAVLRTNGIPEELVATGCITTKPGRNRKGNQAADDIRRAGEVASAILGLLREYQPDLIVGELPYGSQHAKAAKAEGMCKGIMASLREFQQVPCLWVLPQAGKLSVCGVENASKANVERVVLEWWPEAVEGLKTAQVEHVADALAAATAARTADLHAMTRRLEALKEVKWEGERKR